MQSHATATSSRPRSGLAASVFVLAVAAAVAVFAYPIFIIRPFRHQGPQSLALALRLLALSWWLAPLCVAIAFIAAIILWRRRRWLARTGIIFGLLLAFAAAGLGRINVYEKMFHPDLSPRFIPAAQAAIQNDDMVMAVSLGGEARAYPIREMAYHHVVNDTLGGQPIAATY